MCVERDSHLKETVMLLVRGVPEKKKTPIFFAFNVSFRAGACEEIQDYKLMPRPH